MNCNDRSRNSFAFWTMMATVALALCMLRIAYAECSFQSCITFTYVEPSTSPCTGPTFHEVFNSTVCSNPCLGQVATGYWMDGYCVADALFPNTNCNTGSWSGGSVPVLAYDSNCEIAEGNQANCPCELVDLGQIGELPVIECTVTNCPIGSH